ncbi:hypothetical protein AMAG_01292 [Allomyces macrogynus ATCC 38327]|uniref:Importin N-terminal domain-containing protein n=1 Tax=Allomyces macrogynus (strain ATCC 38327) TaxID=578462 RepID=A0A0L0RZ85_ALLM3|nr:hypothetical protein AMAG_01292 [Allomyces macrogynus ATCC 38327]|eukprot:KNE55396.1 hypothetical protein AMAG_01292 [Allomyces macrogynus ATCC 38327]
MDFATQLYQLLSTTAAATDSETLRQATTTLNKQFYSNAQCLPALIRIAAEAADAPLRQLAAVEARKRVDKFWLETPPDVRAQLQQVLVQRVVAEPDTRTAHGLARVISAVARIEVPAGRWTELIPLMVQAAGTSPTVAHREVGIYVLLALFEVLVDHMQPQLPTLFDLFAKTLADPESRLVRVTTLEALGEVAEYVGPEDKRLIQYLIDLTPQMVTVLREAIEAGDENGALRGFNVFDTLLSSETNVLNAHFAPFVEFLVGTFANTTLADSIRVMAGNMLVLLPLYRRQRLIKLKLSEPVLTHILPVTTEHDADEDEDEDTPGRVALRAINSFATNLPPQQVFPFISAKVSAYAQDPHPGARRAAMMCVALILDGCADAMRSHVADLVDLVLHLMQDADVGVRKAACIALSALADALDGEVCAQHAKILPVLFALMQDNAHVDVLRNATNALDAVLDGLGDDILPYIHALMESLGHMLAVPDVKVRQVVTAAIGSAAHASGIEFVTYFPHVYPRIAEIMAIQSEDAEEMLLRGIATDTMSAMADAVGADVFRPYLQQVAALATESMQLDSPKLKECAYCFFGVLSRSFKAEFTAFLPTLVPVLFESIKTEENFFEDDSEDLDLSQGSIQIAAGSSSAAAASGALVAAAAGGDDGFVDMDDDDEDDDDEDAFKVNSAIAEEKSTAIDVLGDLFEATEAEFLPYLDETMSLLLENTTHYHDAVRKSIILSLFKILAAMHKMSNPVAWQAGLPAPVPLHENVANMAHVVMSAVLTMFEEEDERIVAAELCDALQGALRLVGPALIQSHGMLDKLANLLLSVLQGKHLSQMDEDGEDMDADELAEYDGMLIAAAGDVVGALAHVLGGAAFAPYGQRLLPQLNKYFKPSSQTSERSMAVGVLADVAAGLRDAVTAWHGPMLHVFTRALEDPELEVQSNGCFGLGVLAEFTTTAYDAAALLAPLVPRVSAPAGAAPLDIPQARDNACGAVARILLRADHWRTPAVVATNALPLLIASLPLRADYEENRPVFDLIGHLLRLGAAGDVDALAQLPAVLAPMVAAVAHVLAAEDEVNDESRAMLGQTLVALAASATLRGPVQEAVAALTPEMQQAVQKAMAA